MIKCLWLCISWAWRNPCSTWLLVFQKLHLILRLHTLYQNLSKVSLSTPIYPPRITHLVRNLLFKLLPNHSVKNIFIIFHQVPSRIFPSLHYFLNFSQNDCVPLHNIARGPEVMESFMLWTKSSNMTFNDFLFPSRAIPWLHSSCICSSSVIFLFLLHAHGFISTLVLTPPLCVTICLVWFKALFLTEEVLGSDKPDPTTSWARPLPSPFEPLSSWACVALIKRGFFLL